MKIAIVQAAIGPMTLDLNVEEIFTRLEEAVLDDPEVVVLPEMWNTGFSPADLKDSTDYRAEELKEAMATFAREHDVFLVAGSLAMTVRGARRNRAFVFDKEGKEIARYDKAHLFPVGGESELFASGEDACRFTLGEIPAGLITCYDLRFPEWARLAVMGNSKILFVPMAWHLSRLSHMHLFSRARAAENQCFVVSVNCTRREGYSAMGGGGSCIFGPGGEELLMMDQRPGHATVDLDLGRVEEEKAFFDLWRGRRAELYGDLVDRRSMR
ncbi:MAG: nitrilase-related carbon-nitrogen hydrolase [Peptoniphilus sp.]|nr:nitrilase-related carbon-nitrogen hydrolase [Peptoniphilus sp.]MDD7363447.1 hypothetical protein [Bacillota bacterium]MDY6044849.1 nitrilase-related carbon-nitrogen hydrolase [Peptoniphilus sp.]